MIALRAMQIDELTSKFHDGAFNRNVDSVVTNLQRACCQRVIELV